jgi:signal transduction histidine kinase
MWIPLEHPGSRPTRSWVFDVSVLVVAAAITAPYGFAREDVTSLPAWSVDIISGSLLLPLLVRRIWPVPVFVSGLVVAAATGWWAMQVVWSPALVISLYTVAALRPRRDAIIAGLAVCAGAVVATIHVLDPWYGATAFLVTVAVAATGLGLYINTRRVLLDQLRERATRLELERDQQAALAAASERARIAREMHDIVAHHLTVMVALADGAAAQAICSPEQAAEAMRDVSATGRSALADTRRLLGVLRDDSVGARAPLPSLESVDQLVERVRAAGLPVQYETEGERPDLAPAVALTLFRIVQEALTNTMKHGGDGVRATVRIRYAPDAVRIQIDDDGQGSVDGTFPGAGRGLAGMRERVSVFGGDVAAGPRSPCGWSVSACVKVLDAA